MRNFRRCNLSTLHFFSNVESEGCRPAGGEVGIPTCYAGLRKQTPSPMRKPIILATLVHFALRCALCSTLFTTQAHAGYRYRYQVTVDHTQAGSSDSASFPILVYISSNNDFKTAANGGYIQNTTTLNGQSVPADLIVTFDGGCASKVTAWEVASYSASSGTVELWVNQGSLSHTVNRSEEHTS